MYIAAAAAAAQVVLMMDGDKKDGQRVLLAVGLSAAKDNSSVTEVSLLLQQNTAIVNRTWPTGKLMIKIN